MGADHSRWLVAGVCACGSQVVIGGGNDRAGGADAASSGGTASSTGIGGAAGEGGNGGAAGEGGNGGGAPLPEHAKWMRVFDGALHDRDVAFGVDAGPGGQIAVHGLETLSVGGGHVQSWLVVLDAGGNTLHESHQDKHIGYGVAFSQSTLLATSVASGSPRTRADPVGIRHCADCQGELPPAACSISGAAEPSGCAAS